MRRADANIGDAVEFKVGGKWRPGTIVSIGSHFIYVEGWASRWELLPKLVRKPKIKSRPERERRSLRGAHEVGQTAGYLGAIAGDHPEAQRAARTAITSKRGPALSRPKAPKPVRDQAYLAFVRSKPCIFLSDRCRGPVEAHHHGKHALGQKTDDTRCVPLCHGHHREVTDMGYVYEDAHLERPEMRSQLISKLTLSDASVDLLVEYDRMRRTR